MSEVGIRRGKEGAFKNSYLIFRKVPPCFLPQWSIGKQAVFLVAFLFIQQVQPVFADHLGREEKAEPIFTQNAFLEKQLEFSAGLENESNEHSVEFEAGVTWIFLDRLQLGLEIPFELRDPDGAKSVFDLSDIGISTTFLICCSPPDNKENQFFLSITGDIQFPTGDQDKEIGGTGEWGFSLNAGYFFPFFADIAEFGIQLQLAYAQQLRLTDEQKDLAGMLGISRTREKDIIWNAALTQQYLDGRLVPVLEVLGTSIVDSLEEEDEGTILELGFGLWLSPFSDDSILNAMNVGAGAKFPVTDRKESSSTVLLIVTYGFD